MFASVFARVTNIVRNAIHAIGAAMRATPWMGPVVILMSFLVVL